MTNSGMSLRARALLAIGLMVGFYLLALGLAAGLLYIPYAEWVYADHFTARLALFCVVGAGAILKAVVPRIDRFTPPGPELTQASQPKLTALVREVAAATGQAMPSEIYLAPDVNAFVMERGGVMGIGSKRVMGVGLPLLASLSIGQLRAVIAHEFGHYVGGDTKLGPWIYKTRAAILRTVHSLAQHSGILMKPFEWYGLAFLRITHAVSRGQEFVADATAVRVAGKDAMKGALQSIERAAVAYGPYWQMEVGAVVDRGYRPPFIAGFQRFVNAPSVMPKLEEHVAHQIAQGKSDPYDTHPSLRERLAAIDAHSASAGAARAGDDALAITLLDDVAALESKVVDAVASPKDHLTPITWEDVPTTVLPLGWSQMVRPVAKQLEKFSAEKLAGWARALTQHPQAIADELELVRGASNAMQQAADERAAHAAAIIGAALALVLVERSRDLASGLTVSAPPGEPVVFHVPSDGAVTDIQPFAVLQQLREGTLTDEQWRAQCAVAGIEKMMLAPKQTSADHLLGSQPTRQRFRYSS